MESKGTIKSRLVLDGLQYTMHAWNRIICRKEVTTCAAGVIFVKEKAESVNHVLLHFRYIWKGWCMLLIQY